MVISAYLQSPASGAVNRRMARRTLHLEVQGAQADNSGIIVKIHNISRTGMLIESDAPLAVDDRIDVELPHAGRVSTKLIWNSGLLFGCEFDNAISAAAISAAELRGTSTRGSVSEPPVEQVVVEEYDPVQGFGSNLKRLRIARGLSQAAVAALLDVSAPSISGWEKGRARPKPDRLAALASVLGVGVSQLLVNLNSEPFDELIRQGRDRIARATGASPDKIRIFIEV